MAFILTMQRCCAIIVTNINRSLEGDNNVQIYAYSRKRLWVLLMDMKWTIVIIIIQTMLFTEDYIILKKKNSIQNLLLISFLSLVLLYLLLDNELLKWMIYINTLLNYLQNLWIIRVLKKSGNYKKAIFHQFIVMVSLALIIIFV